MTQAADDDSNLTMTPGGIPIRESRQAGGYFCEHALFAALHWEKATPGIIGLTPAAEPLIGFLHVPEAHDEPDSPNRHLDTVWILARILSKLTAYLDKDRITFLLTGYDAFGHITNNPTGHLVQSSASLEQLCHALTGTWMPGSVIQTDGGMIIEGKLHHAKDRRSELRLVTHELPVAAEAVNGGRGSIQSHLAKERPDAAILMGIASKTDHYRLETWATQKNFQSNAGCNLMPNRKTLGSQALVWALSPEFTV
jgi:pyrrolidone-carboxylate peptidase